MPRILPTAFSSIAALSLLYLLPFTTATSSPSPSPTALYTTDPAYPGSTFFWISRVTPTIFGENAEKFDYQFVGPAENAKEAMGVFAELHASYYGDGNDNDKDNDNDNNVNNNNISEDQRAQKVTEEELAVAFLNVTMVATLLPEDVASTNQLCAELWGAMAKAVGFCKDYVEEMEKEVMWKEWEGVWEGEEESFGAGGDL